MPLPLTFMYGSDGENARWHPLHEDGRCAISGIEVVAHDTAACGYRGVCPVCHRVVAVVGGMARRGNLYEGRATDHYPSQG